MRHPNGAWFDFINAVHFLGAIVAFPVVAWFVNSHGRRKTIALGYFWVALGVDLQTEVKNEAMFIVGRFCLGQFTAWFAVPAPLLTSETNYLTHRGVATALYNTGWYIGKCLS
jgi:MFS family permease